MATQTVLEVFLFSTLISYLIVAAPAEAATASLSLSVAQSVSTLPHFIVSTSPVSTLSAVSPVYSGMPARILSLSAPDPESVP